MSITIPPEVVSLAHATKRESDNRYAFNCVRVSATDGKCRAEATDTHIAAVYEFEDRDGGDLAPSSIHADDLKMAAAVAPKFTVGKKRVKQIRASNGDGKVTFQTRSGELRVTPDEGRFPKIIDVMPKDEPKFSILLRPEVLMKAVKILAAFGSEAAEFRFRGDDSVVEIQRDGLTILVMPVAKEAKR